MKTFLSIFALLLLFSTIAIAQHQKYFSAEDVFELEFASGPQISPDGSKIIYQRNFKDIMADANRSNLWQVDVASGIHTPFTTGQFSDRNPVWSPDGKQIAYISNHDGKSQIFLRWLEGGMEARLTNLNQSPKNLSWSPDGKWIAFVMPVEYDFETLKATPKKPNGAEWADPPIYIDRLKYRADGAGYLKHTFQQVFILSTDGGTPRQLTFDSFNHGSNLSWHPDGTKIYFSANRHADHEYEPLNSEIYVLNVNTGDIAEITSRKGPDQSPQVSPDGKHLAYIGFDDHYQGYQLRKLYLYDFKTQKVSCLSNSLDRSVGNIQWQPEGNHIFFQYDDEGITHIAKTDLTGNIETMVSDVGGMSLGRPYSGGTYDVGKAGMCAFTLSKPDRPADLALYQNNKTTQLTQLNEDLFGHKKLGAIEEIWWESDFDQQKVQGWICTPPDFDPNKKYPLLLEIHGGPFTNYGPRFSAEIQLYAAAGYVVLFTNPRGSTSYGEKFGNLIHHNYPGNDYDDLMSGVDAVIEKGYIEEDQLYVTGGSGGGVLTSWIVGKTDRFRAAVVAKPVINWYSFVLHADNPAFFYKYWFPGPPWEHEAHYMKRSPISLVGNVKTPTMLLTGENDYRTPMSETEQYYAALKLNKVDAAMVRIPGAGHGIANKPSQLIAKVNSIKQWFDKYQKPKT
jgi:acylaminoacyl-peptidase